MPKNKSKVKGHRKPHIINTVQPETVAEMMKPVDPAEVVVHEGEADHVAEDLRFHGVVKGA